MRNKKNKKNISNRVFGDDQYIKKHYERLYGVGDYSCEIKILKKENKRKIIIIMIIIIIGVIANISQTKGYNIVENEEGRLIKVCFQDTSLTTLDVKITAKNKNTILTKTYKIFNKNKEEKQKETIENKENITENEINQMVTKINNSDSKEIVLPTKLSDGTKLYWEKKSNNHIIYIIILGIAMIIFSYKRRYYKIIKEEKKTKIDVIYELPIFINKLVLFLEAGMVFPEAYGKILYENKKQSYFYFQLEKSYEISRKTNTNIENELSDFGRRLKIKELRRFTNTINDCRIKGVDALSKLKIESENMWFARKKNAEELGKIAETKMTFPLVILIIVLLTITVSPALLKI